MMKKSLMYGIAALMMASTLGSCNKSSGNDVWDNIDLIPVQVSKEKWSFVDKAGQVKFEDDFKECPTVVIDGVFSIREKDKITAYKIDGDKYNALGELEEMKCIGYLAEGLIIATAPHQRIAVYDNKGKKKFELNPVGGQEIVACAPCYDDGMLPFMLEDGKCGYLDKDGKVAIKAAYDEINEFREGLAVVAKYDSVESKSKYTVIDKKGENVFKLKDGQYPMSWKSSGTYFENGYLRVRDDDRIIFYDKKGEVKKFPTKFNDVVDTDGKYFIFKNDDGDYGVATLNDDEVVLKAKYDDITFNGDGNFLVKKDDEYQIINVKGDEIASFDYDVVVSAGDFGYIVKDKSRWMLVDEQDKQKGKDDFYDINFYKFTVTGITSDYFDIKGVAARMADLIDGTSVAGYKLGITASQFFVGESPESYGYKSQVNIDKAKVDGYRYEITGNAIFNETIASSDWDSNNYEWRYYWNPSSHFIASEISMKAESEFGKEGFDALMNALKSKGFSVSNVGYMGANPAAIMTKGNTSVCLYAENNGNQAEILVLDSSYPECSQQLSMVKSSLTDKPGEETQAVEAVEEWEPEPDYWGEDEAVEAVAEEAW